MKNEKGNGEEIESGNVKENEMGNSNELSVKTGTTTCTIVKTMKTKQDALEKASRFKNCSPYNQSVENLYLKRQKRAIRAHQRCATYPVSTNKTKIENEGSWNNSIKVEEVKNQATTVTAAKKVHHSRSTSQPSHVGKMKYDNPVFEKVRHAKQVALCAIRVSEISKLFISLFECFIYKSKSSERTIIIM
jgi:hypothetical protein